MTEEPLTRKVLFEKYDAPLLKSLKKVFIIQWILKDKNTFMEGTPLSTLSVNFIGDGEQLAELAELLSDFDTLSKPEI